MGKIGTGNEANSHTYTYTSLPFAIFSLSVKNFFLATLIIVATEIQLQTLQKLPALFRGV